MNIKSFIVAAVCALPLLSHAGVVYQWQPINDETPRGITLQLEFDRKTVKNGEFYLQLDQGNGGDSAPKKGLLNLRYSYDGSPWPSMNYSAKDGGFDKGLGSLTLHFVFDSAGFLTGRIFATDKIYQSFEMESDARVFTVVHAGTEFDGMEEAGCTFGQECSGAMGYIRRVSDVPEPISLTLFAIGAVGFATARRNSFKS